LAKPPGMGIVQSITLVHLSGCKVVKREVEVVLPVDRILRLFSLGKVDRTLQVSLGFGGAIEFGGVSDRSNDRKPNPSRYSVR
jgi:hypothetical protein